MSQGTICREPCFFPLSFLCFHYGHSAIFSRKKTSQNFNVPLCHDKSLISFPCFVCLIGKPRRRKKHCELSFFLKRKTNKTLLLIHLPIFHPLAKHLRTLKLLHLTFWKTVKFSKIMSFIYYL